MYTPYVRGKQFELLGLREIIEPILLPHKNRISPIIEPVNLKSALSKTLKEFASKEINFTIIINPYEGDLQEKTSEILSHISEILPTYTNFQLGIINNSSVDHNYISTLINHYKLNYLGLSFIHNSFDVKINEKINLYDSNVKYNIINKDFVNPRFKAKFEANSCILFGDHFQARDVNREYLSISESDFSDDINYYSSEGFAGFGDYGTIGSKYSEKGFLPYAVAIHISYYNEQNSIIRVRHFTSDSNDDQNDTPGKFAEAHEKLNQWVLSDLRKEDRTIGLKEFLKLYREQHYPGLGTVKKLSLMNHIEVIMKNMP